MTRCERCDMTLDSDIRSVGVVGAGAMGTGIAQVAAAAGHSRRPRRRAAAARRRRRAAEHRARRWSARSQKGRHDARRGRRAACRASTFAREPLGDDLVGYSRLRPGHRSDRRGSRRRSRRCFGGSRRWSRATACSRRTPRRCPWRRSRRRATRSERVDRHPLLQSAAAHAARRDRAVARRRSGDRAGGVRADAALEEDAGARVGHAGVHRQPHRAAVLRRVDPAARGRHRRRRRRSTGR